MTTDYSVPKNFVEKAIEDAREAFAAVIGHSKGMRPMLFLLFQCPSCLAKVEANLLILTDIVSDIKSGVYAKLIDHIEKNTPCKCGERTPLVGYYFVSTGWISAHEWAERDDHVLLIGKMVGGHKVFVSFPHLIEDGKNAGMGEPTVRSQSDVPLNYPLFDLRPRGNGSNAISDNLYT